MAAQAKKRGMTFSKFLAELVKDRIKADVWPEGYFERIAGSCRGLGLKEHDDLALPEEDDVVL